MTRSELPSSGFFYLPRWTVSDGLLDFSTFVVTGTRMSALAELSEADRPAAPWLVRDAPILAVPSDTAGMTGAGPEADVSVLRRICARSGRKSQPIPSPASASLRLRQSSISKVEAGERRVGLADLRLSAHGAV